MYNVLHLQTSMLGMKRDCGGAAGILGGFRAAVKQVGTKTQNKNNIIKIQFITISTHFIFLSRALLRIFMLCSVWQRML